MTGSTTANVIGCGLNDGTANITANGGTVTMTTLIYGQTMGEIKLVPQIPLPVNLQGVITSALQMIMGVHF